jgi:hypothetical protein
VEGNPPELNEQELRHDVEAILDFGVGVDTWIVERIEKERANLKPYYEAQIQHERDSYADLLHQKETEVAKLEARIKELENPVQPEQIDRLPDHNSEPPYWMKSHRHG